jgi:O-antigen/teichoic acid export membrane protein
MIAPAEVAGAPPRPSLLRGSALYLVAHGSGLGLSLLTSVLLVRVTTPADTASYLLFLQAVALVTMLLHGVAPATLRFAPLARGEGGAAATAVLRRRLLALLLLLWLLLLPPLLLVWPWLTTRLGAAELAAIGTVAAGVAALTALGRVITAYLRSFRSYVAAAFFDQLGIRGILCGGLVLLYLRHRATSWVEIAGLFAAATAVTMVVQVTALLRTTPLETPPGITAHAAPPLPHILRAALALGGNALMTGLLFNCDLWVLSANRPHHEVAVYGMMLRLLQVVAVSPLVAAFVVPQEFSRLHAEGKQRELEALARGAATGTTLVALAGALVLLLAGRPLIAWLFGPLYVAGWGILLVLVAARLWDAAAGPAASLLLMTGHHRRVLATTAAGAIGGLLLALLLAPRLGGPGVATAVALALALTNVVNVHGARRLLGVHTYAYGAWEEWRRVALLPWSRLRARR